MKSSTNRAHHNLLVLFSGLIGVARSGETLANYNLSKEVEYTITSKHMQVYAGENMIDVRGQWEYRGMFKCTTEALDVLEVEESIAVGFTLQEIRLQPYEIQVVIEEPENGSLAGQVLCIEAFVFSDRCEPSARTF